MRPASRSALAVARVDFRVPGSRSLKEKRRVVRSFLERARSRFGIAAVESGWRDDRSLASLTLAALADRAEAAEGLLRAAVALLEDDYAAEVFAVEAESH